MAIEYPREMPSTRVRSMMFEAEPQEAFAPEQGGRFVSVQLGRPLWRMQLQTTPPTEEEFSIWRAWLDSLDGAAKMFFGYDVRRPRPWAHRADGALDNTIAVGATYNAAGDEITVGTASPLATGFTFTTGDYLQLRRSQGGEARYSLHRFMEGVVTQGGAFVATVRPAVHAAFPSGNGVVVDFFKCACLMRVTRRDLSAEHKSRSISFEAVEHFDVSPLPPPPPPPPP